MGDILFKCWKCAQVIAIPDKAAGRTIMCPDCFKQLTVPAPSIKYKCVSCGYDLCSPETYAGDKVKCPSCQQEFVIPKELSAPDKPADSVADEQTILRTNEEDKATASAVIGKSNNVVLIPCPACGKQMSQRSAVCPSCGKPIKLFDS